VILLGLSQASKVGILLFFLKLESLLCFEDRQSPDRSQEIARLSRVPGTDDTIRWAYMAPIAAITRAR
jgi:hypothetical protein